MADTTKPADDAEAHARREFLKKVGKLGVAVPAVSLLLAANHKASATPITPYGGGCGCGGGSCIPNCPT